MGRWKTSFSRVCGIGINDADYTVNPRILVNGKYIHDKQNSCPFYRVWVSLLKRCCDNKNPTYADCTVCEEWLTFSNFRFWMENQDWKSKHLDKDLLIEGNKVYSPDTCVFITQSLNSFLTLREKDRGKYPLGVCRQKSSPNFRCTGQDINGKRKYLGMFSDPMDAHIAYLQNKLYILETIHQSEVDVRVLEGINRVINKLNFHINNRLELFDL